MKLEVTRNVVGDLWPLCQSGDASAESRALVDAFLREDETFARILRESESRAEVLPRIRLSPDAERRLLDDARGRAQLKLAIVGGAIAMGGVLLLALMGAVAFFLAGPR